MIRYRKIQQDFLLRASKSSHGVWLIPANTFCSLPAHPDQ